MNPRQDFLTTSGSGDKMEYYWAQPDGAGPFPVLLMIHPHQDSPKNGGKIFVDSGQIDFWVSKGFLTISLSQPGYGKSTGGADFCGPKTLGGAIELIKHFQAKPNVNAKQFFIYGGSRGATVAAMLAAQDLKITGLILKSGVYDFVEWATQKPWHDEVKFSMLLEIGWLNEAKLKERSAIYLADKIKTPLLVIHGMSDPRAPLKLAEKFVKKVNQSQGNAKLLKLEAEHLIPMPDIAVPMEEFLKSHL